MKKLNENAMSSQEEKIPGLAEGAFRQAYANALAAGRSVVEAEGDKLVRTFPDGTKQVIKDIPAPVKVTADLKRRFKIK